jgi:hypothetical protein
VPPRSSAGCSGAKPGNPKRPPNPYEGVYAPARPCNGKELPQVPEWPPLPHWELFLGRPPVVKMSLANPPSSILRLSCSGGECRKCRRPCPGARSVCKPSRHPHEIDRSGQQQMHEPGFHQPNIARASQIACSGALRNRPFNAGSTGIRLLERFRLLPYPRSLEGGVMISLTEAQCPWRACSARAGCSTGAGCTHGLTEGDTDRGMAMSVGSLHPHDAPLPLRADRACGVPVDHALGRCEAVRCLLWPTLVGHHRPAQVYAGLGPTRQEVVGGHIPHIDSLFPRGQLAGRQVRRNGRQDRKI